MMDWFIAEHGAERCIEYTAAPLIAGSLIISINRSSMNDVLHASAFALMNHCWASPHYCCCCCCQAVKHRHRPPSPLLPYSSSSQHDEAHYHCVVSLSPYLLLPHPHCPRPHYHHDHDDDDDHYDYCGGGGGAI